MIKLKCVGKDVKAFKKCSGYKGRHACEKDYPDHMVPVEQFNSHSNSKDGFQDKCWQCKKLSDKFSNDRKNPIEALAARLVGGSKKYHALSKEDRHHVRSDAKRIHLLNTAPAQEYFNWVDAQKESSIKQRTISIKTRNSTVYDKLKESYNYTCQVESCQETEVEFAHILRHSHPDSVDGITNGWCICRNHHKAYDSNRMIVEINGDFVRYDVHGNVIEHCRIVYNDLHKVNPKFIILAREYWNDREEQEVG